LDPVTGHPRQVSRTVRCQTKTEAQRELRRLIADVEEGKVGPPTPKATGRHALSSLLDEWLANLERAGRSRSTVETYRLIADKHLIPVFGDVPVAQVTGRDIDAYYSAKTEEGLSARTIRLHGAILSSAFTQAVKWEYLASNPVARATPPKKPTVTRVTPEVQQVRKLIDAADGDRELATAVILAAITGARRGELCGLQWGDIDWESTPPTLTIRRSRVPVAGGDVTKTTKTDKERVIALDPLGVEVLKRYWEATLELATEAELEKDLGTPRQPWLLSRDLGFSPLNARWLGNSIKALGEETGVAVTTHAFRRFAATQMVGAGVDVRTAAGRLGHAPDMLLRTYAAFIPSKDLEAASGLAKLVL
jgi:integrase